MLYIFLIPLFTFIINYCRDIYLCNNEFLLIFSLYIYIYDSADEHFHIEIYRVPRWIINIFFKKSMQYGKYIIIKYKKKYKIFHEKMSILDIEIWDNCI